MLITQSGIDFPKDTLPDNNQLVLLCKSKSSNQLQTSERVINTLWLVPSSIFAWESFAIIYLYIQPQYFLNGPNATLNIFQDPIPDTIYEPIFSPFSSLVKGGRETQSVPFL